MHTRRFGVYKCLLPRDQLATNWGFCYPHLSLPKPNFVLYSCVSVINVISVY